MESLKLMSNEERMKLLCKDIKTYFKKKNEKINFDKRMEEGDQDWLDLINKESANSSIKIRIYPTKEQKQTLNKWFGVRRFIYNKCLASIKKKECKENLKDLRNKNIYNSNYETKDSWMLDYNYDLRDEALRDLMKNINSNRQKQKLSDKPTHFEMKYKSKKMEKTKNESISVLGKYWNNANDFYSSVFRPDKLKSAEPLPERLMYTSRLIKTPTNKYFISIPKASELMSDNQAREESMLFIDPGVKTFLTGYDPSGKIIICGEHDISRIARLLYYKRKLFSKQMKATKCRKRSSYKLACLRMGEKIENLVNELHKKLTKWLCENYKHIYIPRLNFHKCKKMNKRSKANMASLRHCSFVDRLLNKSKVYPSCNVIEVNEAFTSKTCSRCGWQNDNLRNKNIFICNSCNLVIGRDINASKNVMLRYFTKRVVIRDNSCIGS